MSASYSKWRSLLAEPGGLAATDPVVPALTPFNGTGFGARLTAAQRSRLYWLFLAFQAEAFVTLEELLMLGLRRLARANGPTDAFTRVAREESFHSQAFLQALRGLGPLRWPQDSVFLRKNRRLKNALALVARRAPHALALPAAKLEVYTICYGRFATRFFPKDHRWHRLHAAHIEDEIGHIKVDFQLFAQGMAAPLRERARLILWSFALTLLLQLMLFSSCMNILAAVFPERSRAARLGLGARFFRWVLRDFPPYAQTRLQLRLQFHKWRPPYARLFAFMHW